MAAAVFPPAGSSPHRANASLRSFRRTTWTGPGSIGLRCVCWCNRHDPRRRCTDGGGWRASDVRVQGGGAHRLSGRPREPTQWQQPFCRRHGVVHGVQDTLPTNSSPFPKCFLRQPRPTSVPCLQIPRPPHHPPSAPLPPKIWIPPGSTAQSRRESSARRGSSGHSVQTFDSSLA